MSRQILPKRIRDLPIPPFGIRYWLGIALIIGVTLGGGFLGNGACSNGTTIENTIENTNENTNENTTNSRVDEGDEAEQMKTEQDQQETGPKEANENEGDGPSEQSLTEDENDEQEETFPVEDEEIPSEQDQTDSPPSTAIAPLTVEDGEQIFRPGTGEVYVVKVVGDERYMRHFLTPKIRDSYGHLIGVEPTSVSQEEFDSFIISCLVEFEGDHYFLDVREGVDSARKHLITDGRQSLVEAGVSPAAIFRVHALEINNSAFVRGSDIDAAEAAQKNCGN